MVHVIGEPINGLLVSVIKLNVRGKKMHLIKPYVVTTEVATIVLFRIQRFSDWIQRSVEMEVAGFLEPQLAA